MSSPKGKRQKVSHEGDKEIYLVASGDLRLSANQKCWPAQDQFEKALEKAFAAEGCKIIRAHPYDEKEKHGFISSQRMGMQVFQKIPPKARVIVAEAVWQYSYHVLPGLRDHNGPILTVANWSPTWPGLVGMLNLNASLTKMGKPYSTIWSRDCTDEFFINGIRSWLKDNKIVHDGKHVHNLKSTYVTTEIRELAQKLAAEIRREKVILGIFDEGCMGMYNAIFDDYLLNEIGFYKERLSQSALYAAMLRVTDEEAKQVKKWVEDRGLKFRFGKNKETELTEDQVLEQCKMYIAAGRIAYDFGCDAIGIQYQQGLKDLCAASDLAEGMLNNPERPPIYHIETKQELFPGKPIPHFNEVDQGCAVDAVITNRVWTALNMNPATTLHDIRYGEHFKGNGIDDFVWVFLISGSAPPSHFVGGWKGASSERQPPMYFPKGGGTLKGVSKPGDIVWSRVYVQQDSKGNVNLHVDLGLGVVVDLPPEETQKRLKESTPEWPIMNVVLCGVTRDQMMARHKSNHIQVVYADSKSSATHALLVKAQLFHELGVKVHLCGDVVKEDKKEDKKEEMEEN